MVESWRTPLLMGLGELEFMPYGERPAYCNKGQMCGMNVVHSLGAVTRDESR
jgi:hypothetical protein